MSVCLQPLERLQAADVMALERIMERLRAEMGSRFGIAASRVRFVRAPYRICPLGAHIDHQLGTVTAMAIDRGVVLAYASSESGEVRLGSLAYPGEVHFRLGAVPPCRPDDWGNYARGAASALQRWGTTSQGMVGITSGDLAEIGLSSSASIGVAYLLALEDVNGLQIRPADNIRLDQAIENEYLGLNNGILDQGAVLLSRREHLTVIDCRAFAHTRAVGPAPLDAATDPPAGIRLVPRPATMPAFAVLIAVSGLTQAVVSTDYNRRVAECAEAARILLTAAGRPDAPARLAEVTAEEYELHRGELLGPLARRAAHFFGEQQRVHDGQQTWERGDLAAFGRLVTESGRSSIVNYECGCPPMIDLYEILIGTPGVHGARFSGAGFRGCCVALADPQVAGQAATEIRRAYASRHPELADYAQFFLCQTDDGARIL